MPPRPRLTTAQEVAARQRGDSAASSARSNAPSDEEKAKRKERVERAKDALARSTGMKGEWVTSARTALKDYLRNLNNSRQPSDEQFEALVEAPFKPPPKKRERGFGGGR